MKDHPPALAFFPPKNEKKKYEKKFIYRDVLKYFLKS